MTAIVLLTVLLGCRLPARTTGVGQALFPNAANGCRIEGDGRVVGSKLIGQDFRGRRVLPEPALGDRIQRGRNLLQQPRPEQQGTSE